MARLAVVQARPGLASCAHSVATGGALLGQGLWTRAAGLAATVVFLSRAFCVSTSDQAAVTAATVAAARTADPTPDAQAAAAALWLVPSLSMLPLAARRCLVRNPLNGAAVELSSGEYAVLSACEGCQPLAAHEAQAARQLSAPAEHRPAFRELLERCARQGLLMSLSDLVARFGQPQLLRAAPPPEIVVRTADRPQLLLRLLQGAEKLHTRAGCV